MIPIYSTSKCCFLNVAKKFVRTNVEPPNPIDTVKFTLCTMGIVDLGVVLYGPQWK